MPDWSSPSMKNWRKGQWLGQLRRAQLAYLDMLRNTELAPENLDIEFKTLAKQGYETALQLEELLRHRKGK